MLVVCVGVATEIGKTWVGAQVLAAARRRGITVAAHKPAQSFEPDDDAPTDAAVLAAATGQPEAQVCPAHRWYPRAMAPPMAASALGLAPPTLADLVGEITWPSPHPQLRWVETAGGVRSPIAADGDSVALIGALAPDRVVLVADAGLGTINAIRLCCDALRNHPPVVMLNRFDPADPLHVANYEWLTDRDRFSVVVHTDELLACLLPAST